MSFSEKRAASCGKEFWLKDPIKSRQSLKNGRSLIAINGIKNLWHDKPQTSVAYWMLKKRTLLGHLLFASFGLFLVCTDLDLRSKWSVSLFWPPVELLHLLCGTWARDSVVTSGTVTRPLPSGSAIDVVDVEDPAMAVHPSLPVYERGHRDQSRSWLKLLLQYRSFTLVYFLLLHMTDY